LLIESNEPHATFRPPCESWLTNAASLKTRLNNPKRRRLPQLKLVFIPKVLEIL
jgi:hypothetical protein